MADRPVLIISTDPLIGALLGALVELDGHRPAFHEGGAPPQLAVDRYRPRAILVDVDHRDGASEGFLARQRDAGIPVVLYSASRHRDDVRNLAERWELPWFPMPVVPRQFSSTLAEAMG